MSSPVQIKKHLENLYSWSIYWEKSQNKVMWEKIQEEIHNFKIKYRIS